MNQKKDLTIKINFNECRIIINKTTFINQIK